MTKEEIFNKTLLEIKSKHFEKVLESKNYLQSCYSIPEILEIANKLGEIKIEIAKENDKTNLIEKRNNLKNDLIIALKKYNKDISKIFPKYDCSICKDTGFISEEKICTCFQNKYNQNLLSLVGINLENQPKLDEINLEIYQDKENLAHLVNILNKIKQTKKNTILLTGMTGTGKTYIAKSFIKSFVFQNNIAKFYSAFDLNNMLLQMHTSLNGSKNIDDLLSPDLLVIDDLGSESIYKNVTKEYLFTLLSERQKGSKITLFTTNLPLNKIKETYNERFFSRLMDKELSLKCNFTGNDLRLN